MRVLVCGLCIGLLVVGPCEWAHAVSERDKDRRIEEAKRTALDKTITTQKSKREEEAAALPELGLLGTYFQDLVNRRVTSVADLAQGLMLLLGETERTDVDDQLAYLRSRGILPDTDMDPRDTLRRGMMAYAFYKALDMHGGLWLHLLGTTQRYALKELAYQGIAREGFVSELVTGRELIITIANAAGYLTERL